MSLEPKHIDYEIGIIEPRTSNVVSITEIIRQQAGQPRIINYQKDNHKITKNYSSNTVKLISAIKDNLRSADFQEGGNNMSSNEFVTQKDLDNLEEKIDLKMENIQAKMDAEFRSINSKIDNLPTIFENMLLKNEKEQEIKRKETNRYIWGTLILGTIGVVISVASLFF